MLTIVMYHYVRPLAGSRYPRLKALELAAFRAQLDHLERHYRPVTMEQVIAAWRGQQTLPEQAVLLSFDDGYRDHLEHVLPELERRGLQGSFFPCTGTLRDGLILDVNKIQFVLASVASTAELLPALARALDKRRERHGLGTYEDIHRRVYHRLSRQGRFDDPDTLFFKRLLQRELPFEVRHDVIDELFARFVSTDQRAFAEMLYLSDAEVRQLHEAGMHIGCHGDQHFWFDSLTPEQQGRDLEVSLAHLRNLGVLGDDWVMCYPYGGVDEALLGRLRQLGCAAGLTVASRQADPARDDPLLLPRLDTNDLPSQAAACPGDPATVQVS
ncbi:polysaccharide deacetylase [Halomonas litopenaei]|nr:polysaccharide deacetylase [Halomonas litopenaei]